MKPQNLCPQCGAHINIQTLECPFCHSIFKNIDLPEAKKSDGKKKTRLLLAPPENITDAMLTKKIVLATPGYQAGSKTGYSVLAAIFGVAAIVMFALIFILNNLVLFSVLGGLFVVLGLVFLILSMRSKKIDIENMIIKLIVKKDYEAAADLAKKNNSKTSCQVIYMLIMYFRLSEYAAVKELLFDFDLNKLTKEQYELYEEISQNYLSKL